MADVDTTSHENTTADLRILSPSTDIVASAITFADVPLASTVRELKTRLQNTIPTNPSIERLRLIYLGRVCLDNHTLRQVIGNQYQPDQDSPYVFHLVVQEPFNVRLSGPSFAQQRSSSVPPDARAPTDRQPSPAPFQIPMQRNPQQPAHAGARNNHGPPVFGPQEIVNNLLNQHFTQFGQLPMQIPNPNVAYPPPMLAGNPQAVPGLSPHQQHILQHHLQQQQQQRMMTRTPQNGQSVSLSRQGSASAQDQTQNTQQSQRSPSGEALRTDSRSPTPPHHAVGAGAAPTGLPVHPHMHNQQRPAGPNFHTGGSPLSYNVDGNSATMQGSGVTPQGHRYHMTMRTAQVPAPAIFQQAMQQLPTMMGLPTMPGMLPQGLPFNPAGQYAIPGFIPNQPQNAQPSSGAQSRTGTPGPQQGQVPLPFIIPRHVSPQRGPSDEAMRRETDQIIDGLTQRAPEGQASSSQATTIQNPTSQAEAASLAAMEPSSTPSSQDSSTSNQAQVYVVTNGSGEPQALLVGPSGPLISHPLPSDVYHSLTQSGMPADILSREFHSFLVAVWQSTIAMMRDAHYHNRRLHSSRNLMVQHANSNQTSSTSAGPVPVPVNNAHAVPANPAPGNPPAAGQAQRREPDEMRDFLAPVIRNLWLIVRILGLVYFVAGSGRAIWRPLILGGIIMIIYAVQGGVFGDIFGDRVEWARRYFNRIIGADQREHNIPVRGPGIGQVNAAARQPNASNAQPRPQPTPEDAARRLLEGRRAQDASWIMQQVHSVERTFALFVASLWPGIGEQAVRLQEERERTARQAEENERRRQEEAAAAAAIADAAVASASIGVQQGENSQQVEVLGEPSHDTDARATGVETGEGSSSGLDRVNKGKQRATEDDDKSER